MIPRYPYVLAGVVTVFLIAAVIAVALTGRQRVLLEKQVATGGQVVAGPIFDGTEWEQRFELPGKPPLENIVLGMRFATYGRQATGRVAVYFEQGALVNEHILNAATLKDNAVVHLPFGDVNPGEARIRIKGLGSLGERTATVWCHNGPGRYPLVRNGEPLDRSIDLWISRMEPNRVFLLRKLGWPGVACISVLFGSLLFLLIYGTLRAGDPEGKENRELRADSSLRVVPGLLTGAVAAIIVWALVEVFAPAPVDFISLNDSFGDDLKDAPPLIEGSLLEQEITLTESMANGKLGIGLVFATYKRTNTAKIAVGLSQGDRVRKRVFNSKHLEDNQERRFIFSGFRAGSATVKVEGINGTGSISPTLWLAPAGEPPFIKISGQEEPFRLPVYRYAVVELPGKESAHWRPDKYRWPVFAFFFVFFLIQSLAPGSANPSRT